MGGIKEIGGIKIAGSGFYFFQEFFPGIVEYPVFDFSGEFNVKNVNLDGWPVFCARLAQTFKLVVFVQL